MICFCYEQVFLVHKDLNEACEQMQLTQTQLGKQAEAASEAASKALTAASEDRARLSGELKTVRDCAAKNQEALFAAEDHLGRTLAELQKAQQQFTAAEKAEKHAEQALQEAEGMSLPAKSNANYEMMETGKKNAVKSAKAAIAAAGRRRADAEERLAELELKIVDVKPGMDLCKRNLAELASLSADIGRELDTVNRFIQALEAQRNEFHTQTEELLEQLRLATDQMEQPRQITADAVTLLNGFRRAMQKIKLP